MAVARRSKTLKTGTLGEHNNLTKCTLHVRKAALEGPQVWLDDCRSKEHVTPHRRKSSFGSTDLAKAEPEGLDSTSLSHYPPMVPYKRNQPTSI